MNWIIYAALSAAALAAADLFLKAASGKISHSLGMLLYGSVPFVIGLAWFVLRLRSETHISNPVGVIYGLGVGLMFAAVTFGLYAAFAAGAPVSLASPLIRMGGLLLAGIAGILIWKEAFTARYLLGLCMALGGIYLMIKR